MTEHGDLRYPLQWPAGWKRSKYPQRAKFGDTTVDMQRWEVQHELELLGAKKVFISSNYTLRADGEIRGNQRKPQDIGVAVYFTRKGVEQVIACDSFDKFEHNLRAVAKTVEAMRGIERWGCSELMNRAFQGFKALPEKGIGKSWWEVLGVDSQNTTIQEVNERYRVLAKIRHPDSSRGSPEDWAELQGPGS